MKWYFYVGRCTLPKIGHSGILPLEVFVILVVEEKGCFWFFFPEAEC